MAADANEAVNLGDEGSNVIFSGAGLDVIPGQWRRGGRKANCWEHPILVSNTISEDHQSFMKELFCSPLRSNTNTFRSKM